MKRIKANTVYRRTEVIHRSELLIMRKAAGDCSWLLAGHYSFCGFYVLINFFSVVALGNSRYFVKKLFF